MVRTFHSLCAWMLRVEAKQIGLPADFVIFDEDDCMEILWQCAKDASITLVRENYEDEARRAERNINRKEGGLRHQTLSQFCPAGHIWRPAPEMAPAGHGLPG